MPENHEWQRHWPAAPFCTLWTIMLASCFYEAWLLNKILHKICCCYANIEYIIVVHYGQVSQ